MADEDARPARARKTGTGPGDEPKATKPKTAKAPKAAAKKAGKAPKTALKSVKPAAKPRSRRTTTALAPTQDAIAERAYLLWERGEPGDETEHWLRAEAELRAA